MPIDYRSARRRAWISNLKSFNIQDDDVQKKIANWAVLRGIDLKLLLEDIRCSQYFKYVFAKDPVRQNLYEHIALEFLSGLSLVVDVTKLPSGGEKSLFVHNGILSLGENISRTRRAEHKSKSIDFKFTVKAHGQRSSDLVCYAMHKYTETGGGAQDNQFSDLRLFLYNCPLDRQECYIAFADGDYYVRYLQELKDEFDKPTKRRVFTLNEFERVVLSGEVI